MGAATTLLLAGAYPELPRAVLLEHPPTCWAERHQGGPSAEDRLAGSHTWLSSIKRKTREELIAEQRAATPDWSAVELEPWAGAKHRVSPNILEVLSSGNPPSADWAAMMRRITCPALLITADPAPNAIAPERSASALQALLPQLRVEHIEGAGHNTHRDQFHRCISVVRTFLAE